MPLPLISLALVNPDWFYHPGFTFLVPAHLGRPGQRSVKWVQQQQQQQHDDERCKAFV